MSSRSLECIDPKEMGIRVEPVMNENESEVFFMMRKRIIRTRNKEEIEPPYRQVMLKKKSDEYLNATTSDQSKANFNRDSLSLMMTQKERERSWRSRSSLCASTRTSLRESTHRLSETSSHFDESDNLTSFINASLLGGLSDDLDDENEPQCMGSRRLAVNNNLRSSSLLSSLSKGTGRSSVSSTRSSVSQDLNSSFVSMISEYDSYILKERSPSMLWIASSEEAAQDRV
jgi:hypothetical protein